MLLCLGMHLLKMLEIQNIHVLQGEVLIVKKGARKEVFRKITTYKQVASETDALREALTPAVAIFVTTRVESACGRNWQFLNSFKMGLPI